MATHVAELKGRLGRVRRRWRAAAAARGLLLVATEAMGLFLLFVLADLIYHFGGTVRLGLLAVGGTILAVLFARHVLYPLARRISDQQVALLIEERSPRAEGTVISAVEFGHQRRTGLYNYIVGFLVDDAVRRIDGADLRAVSNLRRLRKHVLAAGALLLFFGATTLTFPGFFRQQTERIVAPWVSLRQEREAAERERERRTSLEVLLEAPLSIEVSPRNARLLRGRGLDIVARLSRQPAHAPVLMFRPVDGGDWQQLIMEEIEALNGYAIRLNDINRDLEYLVAASTKNRSDTYQITVYDPLALKGIELTYRYPTYLESDPVIQFGYNGDVSVPAGTQVDIRLVANNPIQSGQITFEDKQVLTLEPGPKAEDGAKASFTVTQDSTYSFALADVYGEKLSSSDFYYVKAVPDNPPTIEMSSPKVDMSIHPLCEVTFAAKVTDDYGVKDAAVKLDLFKVAEKTSQTYAMKVTDAAGNSRNVKDGTAEYVYQADEATPRMAVGDLLFYHMEVTDRKGQVSRTDVFYVKMWPLEVAAAWPAEINPPDLPHETFNDPMDLMLFLAASWALEQQRGRIPDAEFNGKSEKIADRMYGNSGDFSEFWGHGGAPEGGGPDRGKILTEATRQLEVAYGLLKTDHQPGKAADCMRIALGMVESLARDKRRLNLAIDPEPIHTGQPSSGHADDPVLEQIAFRVPSSMSDSITAYQQPDNPPRLLPPDYRRALKLKERQGERSKQVREAGVIFATEEQLVEMAREQLGHIQLREAIDDNTPPDPAASAGGGNPEERVDRRAIPYKEMVSAAERRASVAEAEKITLSKPEVETVKSPLGGKVRIPYNERRGGPNPYVSQAGGGTPGGGEDEPQPPQRDPTDDLPRLPRQRMPHPTEGGGGGGGDQQPGQPPEPGMQQPGGPQGGRSPQAQGAMDQMAGQQRGLAERARQLARDVAKGMDSQDAMGAQAVNELRTAAGLMDQAAMRFQQGDVRGGIARAEQAMKATRAAEHRLTASQYDSLEAAVAAAQDGAAALAANQRRVSGGTDQLAQKINDMTGGPPQGQPGQAQPGQGQPGQGQPGQGQPGQAQPGQAQPQQGQPGQAQPGQTTQPAQGQPGQGQPGQGQPGAGMPSRAQIDEALKRDPRVGQQIRSLAVEQGNLAQDLGSFQGYVGDLTKWAQDSAKDRVAGTLSGVTEGLRGEGTSQKMLDAAVGLAGKDLGPARASQQDVEKALDDMVKGLQEAGEILAGSPTAVLRGAARDASEIGQRAGALAAGQPGQGQPGQGQPGQGQPGQGQPGQGQPGQRQPGQGQPGQGQPTTQPGQGEPGQGQPTTRPGQGQPGTAQPSTQPAPGEPGAAQPGEDLAQAISNEAAGGRTSGTPSGQPSGMGGGGGGRNEEIDMLWLKTKKLTGVLRREQLVDEQTLQYIERKAATVEDFRKMFERARQIEAGKFSDVMVGVGSNLEQTLQEALTAKRLYAEQQEECPPKYRAYVNAYFEALSKAATSKR